VGVALVAVIASSQFNRSAYITAANKLTILQHAAARRGAPLDPSAIPPQVHAPDFASTLLHDLSHAYAVVFAVTVLVATLAYIPVALLLKKKPSDGIEPASNIRKRHRRDPPHDHHRIGSPHTGIDRVDEQRRPGRPPRAHRPMCAPRLF